MLYYISCNPRHYDELATGLQDVTKEVSELYEIEVDGKSYSLRYYLEILSTRLWLYAANDSCIWCKCHSKDRWNMQLKWSLSDTSKGARTKEEIKTLSKKPAKPAKQQYGCKQLPLFELIPTDCVEIDTLHLFLRIGDLLINLLILDLRRMASRDLSLSRHRQNHKCKVSNNIYDI